MARAKSETIELPALGAEGDSCSQCGSTLATDQRYCLNCGTPRAEPRLDFAKHLNGNGTATAAQAAAPAAAAPASGQWSPITAVGAIAVLGVMLLLGVLIGKDDNEQTVAAAPTTTTTATTPTTTTPETTAAKPDKAAKGAAGAAGAGDTVKGGSGSTEGISTENPLEGLSGKALQDAQKNSPDQIATGGEAEADDPGQAGGGSKGVSIGN